MKTKKRKAKAEREEMTRILMGCDRLTKIADAMEVRGLNALNIKLPKGKRLLFIVE